MLRISTLLLLASTWAPAANPFAGRWDLTIKASTAAYPGWMEVVDKEGALQVRVQPRSGSVRPMPQAKMEGARLIIPMGAAVNRPAMTWDLGVSGNRITGSLKRGEESVGDVEGVRAPDLKRPEPRAWSTPEPLFNGKDLSGWEPDKPSASHWVAKNGELVNEDHGANLRTTRKFDDFKLHVEFNCPDKGNSGIYLRGRYEVQVEYVPGEDAYHRMGSVYGFVATTGDSPRTPGEWESFDITLVGRTVTIVRNGVKIVDRQEIAGITGGALDSNEAEPGPFYIQGDHTGGLKFRNITIAVPKN